MWTCIVIVLIFNYVTLCRIHVWCFLKRRFVCYHISQCIYRTRSLWASIAQSYDFVHLSVVYLVGPMLKACCTCCSLLLLHCLAWSWIGFAKRVSPAFNYILCAYHFILPLNYAGLIPYKGIRRQSLGSTNSIFCLDCLPKSYSLVKIGCLWVLTFTRVISWFRAVKEGQL